MVVRTEQRAWTSKVKAEGFVAVDMLTTGCDAYGPAGKNSLAAV